MTAAWHASNHDGYSACKFPAYSVTMYYTFQDLLRCIVKQEAWLARRMGYADARAMNVFSVLYFIVRYDKRQFFSLQ